MDTIPQKASDLAGKAATLLPNSETSAIIGVSTRGKSTAIFFFLPPKVLKLTVT